MAAHMPLKIEDKQKVLELPEIAERVMFLMAMMESEMDLLQVEKRIRSRVKKQMEKSQREYYLNEQMKAIPGSWVNSKSHRTNLTVWKRRLKRPVCLPRPKRRSSPSWAS